MLAVKNILYVGNKLSHLGFTPGVIETLGYNLEQSGFMVYYAGTKLNPGLRLFEMISKTTRLRKKVNYVLIDTYSTSAFWYAFIIGFICHAFHLRYIPILHGGNLPARIKKSIWASNMLFKNSYANVAVSDYLKYEFDKAGFKTVSIPNNIDISAYPFTLRNNPRPKLLWVRSFHRQYNPNMALVVLAELLKRFPDAQLCMVGPNYDGSLELFEQYSIALDCSEKVRITGLLPRDAWVNLSKDYDFFINTTNVDNTPLSVIEAMSLGMLVISTNAGGLALSA